MVTTERTAIRTCPLCEAGCGLELTVVEEQVTRIRGDRDDVFSHGYLCPKGSTLRQLHDDPDRLRTPLVRRDGELVPATWDEAFAEVARLLLPVMEVHGRDSVAAYVGNPNAHNLAGLLYLKPLLKALGSHNVFSASTVDQRPKELSSAWLFGGGLTVPVPDIDRTELLLILGANPYASNGSLATAPDWPGRIEAMRARGGRLVVVDPRRSRTAEEADQHLAIRPGTDALLLAALVTCLAEADRIDPGPAGPWLRGLPDVVGALAPFTAEAVAAPTGIAASEIRDLAWRLADAPTAAVYGRIGTTTTEFGTLASWLVDVLNAVTGNLDRPGGAMFSRAAAGASNTRGTSRTGRALRTGRHLSRVRGLPETMGELPVACLAEEIDTPGEAQVRALVTVAGNPVLSTPNSGRLDAAMATLDCYVAVDCYVNETTRHAHVILRRPVHCRRVTTTSPCCNWPCTTRPIIPHPSCPSTRVSPTSGRYWLDRLSSPRASVPTPTPRCSTTSWSPPCCRPQWLTSTARSTVVTSPSSWSNWFPEPVPNACSTCCYGQVPTATDSEPASRR